MNIYQFYNNKYTKWYFSIIEKAKNSNRKKLKRNDPNFVYYENHHIIPKCFGGIETILLTAKEHFICHLLLTKMTDDYRMKFAFVRLSHKSLGQERIKLTSNMYEYVKKCNSIATSQRSSGSGHWNYGKKHKKSTIDKLKKPKSEEHKRKLSEVRKGKEPWNKGKKNVYSEETLNKMRKPKTEEHKKNLSLSRKGKKVKPFSKKHRENLSKASKGKTFSEEHRLNISKALKKYHSTTNLT
jgi:hypothetical protein